MSFKKIIFPFFLLMLCFGAHSQDFSALVSKAWEHNQQLKAREFQLESANHLFKEAKSMYGPTVGFGVQYTLAAGGRSIQLPVGDLLNPVYCNFEHHHPKQSVSHHRKCKRTVFAKQFL
jgi:hypothetical protein